jgi:hypothetical protein
MDITKQVLTDDQIKRGFTLEEVADDFVAISLKGKEICQFTQGSGTTKEVIQNTVETLWNAYTEGYQQGRRYNVD